MQKTGKLSVQTENIFSIIKRFLYEEQEVFLRELVANAIDATKKLQTLANKGEINEELGDLSIEIKLDKEKGTLSVVDKGIGMTAEEVEKYINQMAFSGAKEFIEKYKEAEGQIIGFFGLGFYSAFLVAKKVEIITRSYKAEENEAVHWECDGSPEFKMETLSKKERGTEIIVHFSDDATEFNSPFKIKEILNKYCKFLPVPIKFEDEVINKEEPLWLKNPQNISGEDYKKFYKILFPYNEEPIFWIHLNIDYPFTLRGILFFPKIKPYIEPGHNKIFLYVNRMFITDDLRGILPEYLNLLHGVLDSPDIPLNVSRSALQLDSNIRKIQSYISKKVADALKETFRKDRKEYEELWKDIETFMKYASLQDPKFYERIKDILLLKDIDGKYYTQEEFKKETEEKHKDKDNKIIWLYATDKQKQYIFVREAQEKGYKVLWFNNPFDTHFISFFEGQLQGIQLRRIDSDSITKLIDKGVETPSKLDTKKQTELVKIIKDALKDTMNFPVEINTQADETAVPMQLVISEYDRRLQEMLQGMGANNTVPKQYKILVNANHPIWAKTLVNPDEEAIRYMFDLARLPHNLLDGKEFSEFLKKSYTMLDK